MSGSGGEVSHAPDPEKPDQRISLAEFQEVVMAAWWSQVQQWQQVLNPQQRQLRQRLERNPYARFQSAAEVAIAAQWGIHIDVNTATVDDWLRLPGISIHQARTVVALAQNGVQFLCLEDLAAALTLPVQRLTPLAPILQFVYRDPDSLVAPARLNPNTATLAQLCQIPGLSPDLAQAWVSDRTHHGPYHTLADLQNRLQLSPEAIAQLMYYLAF
ncbi:ComEA family DNA-binding protein [Spirulina major CS-329]|uniref:ComEA family DNA-binding protein n=1 Tax=Spirulina TaxID=1154 RepID=UPI002330D65F|nr:MULTISPECIES: ComEA family DNA-binding protein [Spirulina]MDB9495778.1 ComEA family DNA-binding protein [Spirulina subsalsa CS-330]MDB9503226.1 ComEA family DNA-binding protein [Spirulina major CS-329]